VISFKQFYIESNTSGEGGVFGDFSSQKELFGNKDTYATGDARVPKFLGAYTRNGKIKFKKSLKTKKK